MRIIVAQAAGMCFGVEDALAMATAVPQPQQVTIYGELVHNPTVVNRLRDRGFHFQAETARDNLPAAETVLVTAHGISDRRRQWLERSGKTLVDTTCPLVRRAHAAALALAREGRFVIVLGKKGHVEVEGLTGDLPAFAVVETEMDVRPFGHASIGIVCQTTMATYEALPLIDLIRRANPDADIRHVDTICRPTKDRQAALERLLETVDAMVVVGGHHSNNTRKLVERCRSAGRPAWHVEGPEDLRPNWFDQCQTIGLTAGTSTLPETLEQVRAALQNLARQAA